MTLADALTPCNGDYSKLFNTNFLAFNSTGKIKGWSLSRVKPKNKLDYFNQLAADLVKADITNVSEITSLIQRVNEERTKSIFAERKISLHAAESSSSSLEVRFNSKSPTFFYLSNFFETIIVINQKAYPSVEHAYLQWKTDFSGVVLSEEAFSHTSAKMVKKTVKRAVGRLADSETAPDPVPEAERLQKMVELVQAKFAYNPVLKEKLRQLRGFKLMEDTPDRFWGIGSDGGGGQNHLGKILEDVRASLSA